MTLVNQPNMPGYTHNFFGACLPDQLTAGSSFSGITPLVPFIGIILSNCNDLSLILIYSEFLNQRCHSHINILFLLWGCVFKTKLPIFFFFFFFFFFAKRLSLRRSFKLKMLFLPSTGRDVKGFCFSTLRILDFLSILYSLSIIFSVLLSFLRHHINYN